jgi:hypothetical protein
MTSSKAFAACVWGALSMTLGACSLLLDTSAQQCNVDGDCAKRSGSFANAVCENHVCVVRPPVDDGGTEATVDGGLEAAADSGEGDGAGDATDAPDDPIWGCLGKVVWGTPTTLTAKVSIPFYDLVNVNKAPVTDIAMRFCPKLNVMCSVPATSLVDADQDGVVKFEVAAPFDGYGQVFPASSVDAQVSQWVPSLLFLNPPIVKDTIYNPVPLLRLDDIKALAAVMGNTIDPQLGMLFAGMLDCQGKPAAGVIWEPNRIDANSNKFYYVNSFPDENAPATDASGFGGITNLSPAAITLTAKVLATGKTIGSTTLFIRPGYASYTYLAPSP